MISAFLVSGWRGDLRLPDFVQLFQQERPIARRNPLSRRCGPCGPKTPRRLGKPSGQASAQSRGVQRENISEWAEGLADPFSYEARSIDLAAFGIRDDLFGFLEIPKLNVRLGIYLGATRANMARGAVHLTQTSLPIGGINTNAVIAAHRGTRKQDMFLHIDRLQPGDSVMITNAWKTLRYTVTSTEIITPDAFGKVLIRPGRDMVTLISCNPYGQHTQRYVVYCDRAPGG